MATNQQKTELERACFDLAEIAYERMAPSLLATTRATARLSRLLGLLPSPPEPINKRKHGGRLRPRREVRVTGIRTRPQRRAAK